MSREIEQRVFAVIADVFNADAASIGRDTVADDVDGWDSLAHTVLMMRLERVFGIRIDEATASGAGNAGELADAVARLAG
jgi:acyl carrier protein